MLRIPENRSSLPPSGQPDAQDILTEHDTEFSSISPENREP